MANSTREWARRELERAAGNIEWIGQHVNRVEEVYRPAHPEIADACVMILSVSLELQDLINKVRSQI